MYEELVEAAKTSSQGGSKNFDLLDPEAKADVIAFVEFLETTTMSKNTVNSYKSYVTKAILKSNGTIEGELTNDEKSATRKFIAWLKSRSES